MTKNNDNTKDFAEIDLDREKRTGFPEVIFGETKTPKTTPFETIKFSKQLKPLISMFIPRKEGET